MNLMHLHSISAYADQIVDTIDEPSAQTLRSLVGEGALICLHNTWGRAIRNEFGLWEADHPLTRHWHQCPAERDIQEGIDFSLDHPDAVSAAIMLAVWKKVTA